MPAIWKAALLFKGLATFCADGVGWDVCVRGFSLYAHMCTCRGVDGCVQVCRWEKATVSHQRKARLIMERMACVSVRWLSIMVNWRDNGTKSVATQHLATLSHPSPVPNEEAGACKGTMFADEADIGYTSLKIFMLHTNPTERFKCAPECLGQAAVPHGQAVRLRTHAKALNGRQENSSCIGTHHAGGISTSIAQRFASSSAFL